MEMNPKEYLCECGRVFYSPNSFNGHKSGCRKHHESKGTLDQRQLRYSNLGKTLQHAAALRHAEKEKTAEELWYSEKHVCQKCGKIMVEKFGSGKFCSRQCSNSRPKTADQRQQLSNKMKSTSLSRESDSIEKMKETFRTKREEKMTAYYLDPVICKVCGEVISFENRYRKTCGAACHSKIAGGKRNCSGSYSKHGWYKGIYCDSTWELAYVIYNLDNNIPFRVCNRVYTYEYEGKQHKYYPDFELPDGTIIEIKGQHSNIVDIKSAAVTDRPIKVLYWSDIEYAVNWVKDHYSVDRLENLYESRPKFECSE